MVAGLAAYGAFRVCKGLLGTLKLVNRLALRREDNLYQKYGGDGSWVLVTGGTDGIGLAICKAMAQRGFNVVMMGRDEKKINQRI